MQSSTWTDYSKRSLRLKESFRLIKPHRAQAIRAVLKVVCYFDYLVTGETLSTCNAAIQRLLSTLRSLGFTVTWDKVVSPSTRVTFLGITLELQRKRVELPMEKLQALRTMSLELSTGNKITKTELQKIVGHMSFAARAVHGARTFTRPFIDALTTPEKPHFLFRITEVIASELRWWAK